MVTEPCVRALYIYTAKGNCTRLNDDSKLSDLDGSDIYCAHDIAHFKLNARVHLKVLVDFTTIN